MSTRQCVAFVLMMLAAAPLASAAAKYPSCNVKGTTTLKMTDVDKQPPVCTSQNIANYTLPCLLTITMTVDDCNVLQNSTVVKTDAGFPCHAIYFIGNMTAANAASLTGKVSDEQQAASDVASFCLANLEACTSLQSYSQVPVTVWREKSTVYVAASPSCTYTYRISGEDTGLLAGSDVTPAGVSKTSRATGSGLVLASPPASPAANSTGLVVASPPATTAANSTSAGNITSPPASPATKGDSVQRASSAFLVVLAALAAVLA